MRRVTTADDQRRKGQVAAVSGEPRVRSARELGFTGLGENRSETVHDGAGALGDDRAHHRLDLVVDLRVDGGPGPVTLVVRLRMKVGTGGDPWAMVAGTIARPNGDTSTCPGRTRPAARHDVGRDWHRPGHVGQAGDVVDAAQAHRRGLIGEVRRAHLAGKVRKRRVAGLGESTSSGTLPRENLS